MGNVTSFLVGQLTTVRNWWISKEMNVRNSLNNEVVLDRVEEIEQGVLSNHAGIYISNVPLCFDMLWIKNMVGPYGETNHITAWRLPKNMYHYLVVYATEQETLHVLNNLVSNLPAFANDFEFFFVSHNVLANFWKVPIDWDDDVIDVNYV